MNIARRVREMSLSDKAGVLSILVLMVVDVRNIRQDRWVLASIGAFLAGCYVLYTLIRPAPNHEVKR